MLRQVSFGVRHTLKLTQYFSGNGRLWASGAGRRCGAATAAGRRRRSAAEPGAERRGHHWDDTGYAFPQITLSFLEMFPQLTQS
jgi:hypothetical protein